MSGTDNILRKSFLRKVQVVVVSVFIGSFFIADIALAAEQQILFCVDSIKYANHIGKSKCENNCKKYGDCRLDSLLSRGG